VKAKPTRREQARIRAANARATARRSAARAAARAGRTCPVCGGAVNARRSTARYCSTRCRVAASRARVK
jgi:hypothetical protein